MGISNVGTAAAGPLAALSGGIVLDILDKAAGDPGPGPRATYLVGVAFFLLAALALHPVDATPREEGDTITGL